jgi:plastocyanin
MSHTEHVEPIFRTSPQRTARMMAIMLGICIVGGAIFFGMWDYWISGVAPVASAGKGEVAAPVAVTGKEIPISLKFIESPDFRTLAFNALPGEPYNNPTIQAEVGDKIIFNVENAGKSFHSFGVTKEAEGFAGIIPGSDIRSASNPLKPGEGGQSEFIPSEETVYYYICTVPGHREMGMVGKIIVGHALDVIAEPETTESEPSLSSAMPALGSETVPEMIVEEEPKQPMEEKPESMMIPFSGTISIPSGSSVPGCDETNECFIPVDVTVKVGDTVTWSNDDSAAHTVTSGTAADGPDGKFDSSLFMADTTFSYTFDQAGEYNYYCMVHPWMTGKVSVN